MYFGYFEDAPGRTRRLLQSSMKFSYRPLRDLAEPSPALKISDASHKHCVPPRIFWLLFAVSFISVTLNVATLYIWFYSTGPFTPLFPQALYCSSGLSSQSSSTDVVHPAPAQDVLEYKVVKFHSGFGHDLPIYDQPPSDEVDKAWEGLYECKWGTAIHDF